MGMTEDEWPPRHTHIQIFVVFFVNKPGTLCFFEEFRNPSNSLKSPYWAIHATWEKLFSF
jgi:hypothetical protein